MIYPEKEGKNTLYNLKNNLKRKEGEKYTGYKATCPHNVRGYCKQCLASLPEEPETVINTIDEIMKAPKTDNLPTIDRPVNPNIEPKYLSKWQADYFRVNLKGNKPYQKIDWYNETVKFKALRLSAYYSVKRYCINFGIRFDFQLFEDSFQESILEYYQYYVQMNLPVKKSEKNYLLKGVLNKLCRKHYGRERRWLNNNSLEQLLEEADKIITGKEIEKTEINYRIAYSDKGLLDTEFKLSCKKLFNETEQKIVAGLIGGYKKKEIARYHKLNVDTITDACKRVQLAIISGALYQA